MMGGDGSAVCAGLTNDALALVEYALDLVARGCIVDLTGEAQHGGGHRRQLLRALQFLVGHIGSTAQCSWDKLDDLAVDVNMICCGADNEHCGGGGGMPDTCSPGCAVSLHQVNQTSSSWFRRIDVGIS